MDAALAFNPTSPLLSSQHNVQARSVGETKPENAGDNLNLFTVNVRIVNSIVNKSEVQIECNLPHNESNISDCTLAVTMKEYNCQLICSY